MCEPDYPAGERHVRLILDYGADEQTAPGLTVHENGLHFRSRWSFDFGTQLSVGCSCGDSGAIRRPVHLEGVVVCCERHQTSPEQPPLFETTLLFLELPDDLRKSLREFSSQLLAA